ncbi:hypothetical protein AB4Y85_18145 [Microvirga sp. 2YAF29]|uniref:hypothetical protein n=1 Tax=Microvirga sp. 2YAF29 TaxID=3233031 RepID=UPI003F99B5A0
MNMDREQKNSTLATAFLDMEDEILQLRSLACTITLLVEEAAKRIETRDAFTDGLVSSLIGQSIDMSHKACGMYVGYHEKLEG